MVVKAGSKAQVFNLRMPLLSEGMSMDLLTNTELLWIWGKVYAQGGENALHAHTGEDHAFVVLDGEATFHDQDDNITVVKRYEGILLPKGAYYYFQSTGDTNLVMMRVGATTKPMTPEEVNSEDDRVDLQGRSLPSYALENKQKSPVPIPGKFFGD